MEIFDKSLCDSIGFSKNKVLVYIPQLETAKIIDINSSLGQKYESFLYSSGEDSEDIFRYKIVVVSEKCFFIFEYEYGQIDFELREKESAELSYFYNNKNKPFETFSRLSEDIPFIKKMNSLLFELSLYNLTISKEI